MVNCIDSYTVRTCVIVLEHLTHTRTRTYTQSHFNYRIGNCNSTILMYIVHNLNTVNKLTAIVCGPMPVFHSLLGHLRRAFA